MFIQPRGKRVYLRNVPVSDTVWRNRLATMGPAAAKSHGLVWDNQSADCTRRHICDIAADAGSFPSVGINYPHMQGTTGNPDLSPIATRIWCLPVTAPQSGEQRLGASYQHISAQAAALTRRYQQPAPSEDALPAGAANAWRLCQRRRYAAGD